MKKYVEWLNGWMIEGLNGWMVEWLNDWMIEGLNVERSCLPRPIGEIPLMREMNEGLNFEWLNEGAMER
jgi:hypothetical protein